MVKMLRDNVLIRVEKREQTDKGIYLPSDIVDKQVATTGWAEEVGPDCKIVKKGDYLFFKEMVGHLIDHQVLDDSCFHLVVSENDIVGVMDGETAKSVEAVGEIAKA